jgi:hypothetical protein
MGRLYHDDFYGWAEDQADALRRRSANEIDWDNLLEEIADLTGSIRRELRRRLSLIVQHLLEWRLQPDLRSRSWLVTVTVQRTEIGFLIEDNPSLKSYLPEAVARAIESGVKSAAVETRIGETILARAAEALTFEELMTAELEHEPL